MIDPTSQAASTTYIFYLKTFHQAAFDAHHDVVPRAYLIDSKEKRECNHTSIKIQLRLKIVTVSTVNFGAKAAKLLNMVTIITVFV